MKKRKASDQHRRFKVRFEKGYDGFIVAECLDIPGCMSQGKTMAEAQRNIRCAIQECLEVMLIHRELRKAGISDKEFRRVFDEL